MDRFEQRRNQFGRCFGFGDKIRGRGKSRDWFTRNARGFRKTPARYFRSSEKRVGQVNRSRICDWQLLKLLARHQLFEIGVFETRCHDRSVQGSVG